MIVNRTNAVSVALEADIPIRTAGYRVLMSWRWNVSVELTLNNVQSGDSSNLGSLVFSLTLVHLSAELLILST